MKKISKILIVAMAVLIAIPLFTSCKKGDGDPFISFYSRKARLCNDWKVNKIEKTVTYKNVTITTTYDGSKLHMEKLVVDTMIVLPTVTLWEYRCDSSYTGSIYFTFDKKGSYQIDEAFVDDSTGALLSTKETGYWFFAGGTHDSDTKKKELLELQPNSYIFNPLSASNYTWTYSGQNVLKMYHIYELAKKEVELRYDMLEVFNLVTVTTSGKITMVPK